MMQDLAYILPLWLTRVRPLVLLPQTTIKLCLPDCVVRVYFTLCSLFIG